MIPKLEECNPPLRPTGYNVLVAVDVLEEITVGGIILPPQHIERENGGSDKGRIVSVSPMAFKGGDWLDEPSPPQVGDVVLFQRYAGKEIELDEAAVKYRVIADADIKGIMQ